MMNLFSYSDIDEWNQYFSCNINVLINNYENANCTTEYFANSPKKRATLTSRNSLIRKVSLRYIFY